MGSTSADRQARLRWRSAILPRGAAGALSITIVRRSDGRPAGSRLRPTTRVYGLLGPHAEQERLREYNAWFARDQWDGVAVPFVADADAAGIVAAFRELPVSGWHIHGETLQTSAAAAVDEMRTARAKVNAIVRRADGALVGKWVESPDEQYELWRGEA